jgi:predicted glycogen debranching enzyme
MVTSAAIASTEPWDIASAIEPDESLRREYRRREALVAGADPRARVGAAAQLVLAADQFIVTPVTRAAGETRAIVAGDPWFTDWGRDTMISLEGLTLVTGRHAEAASILRSHAQYVRDGLVPNLFPEGSERGLYNTADATLWYFHAIDRYVTTTGDRAMLRFLWPTLQSIVEHHQQGTRFNIHVDPDDGLLVQGIAGYQLTWMDAKVGDWVVTPRHGKAVEINALWYNALRLMQRWANEEEGTPAARPYADAAQRAADAFNRRFWYGAGGYLYDVVDGPSGDDRSMRPNQILAISLAHPILDRARWASVIEQVMRHLLTPLGLRTLAPDEPDYHPRYTGDLRSRDAAYHQGTVWPWLIGPFVDAWCKVYPDRRREARGFLAGFADHWSEAGVGSISEIFDAEPPHTPRGCIAQAWSVAEVLRAWVATRD